MRRFILFGAVVVGFFLGIDGRAFAADDCNIKEFTGPTFIIRQDFNGLPTLGCDSHGNAKQAIGTRFSFVRDQLAKTETLQIDGLAAAAIHYNPFNTPMLQDWLNGVAFGPYVQGTGNRQFATASISVIYSDTVTPGGFVEADIKKEILTGILRVHGGELTSNSGVRDPNFVIEYFPRYLPSVPRDVRLTGADNLREPYFNYSVAPEIEFQYDQLAGGPRTYKLFYKDKEATRIGPVLSARLYDIMKDTAYAKTLAPLVFAVTYHFNVDATSGRTDNTGQAVVIYNFGPYAAVSGSYSYENSDATANLSNQFKLARAVKY